METVFAQRAARRRADSLIWELRNGLSALGAVAQVAVLVGLIGSCWGIFTAFLHPLDREGWLWSTIASSSVAEALWWNLAGLGLALAVTAGHRYLLRWCEELELEIELALLILPDALRLLGGRAPQGPPTPPSAAELADRAAERAQRSASLEHSQGLSSLQSIAGVAAFVGLFGTCLWIACYTFKGAGASRSTILAATMSGLTESLLFNASGLLIALTVTWGAHCVAHQHDTLEREMQIARCDLGSALRRRQHE